MPHRLRNTALATMPTVLWEIMTWPSRFLFGSPILHTNDPLKNVSSEFELCKKTEPLHLIKAAHRVVLSTIYGSFAYKVACFNPIVSHLIAKRTLNAVHWEKTFGLFSNSWNWYKTSTKSLSNIVPEGAWPLRPHSDCATGTKCWNRKCICEL